MLDLGFLILLVLWSVGVGRWILRRLDLVPDHPGDVLALALPLGLGALALATMGLAELGWLGVPGILLVLIVGAGLGGVPCPRRRPTHKRESGPRSGWDRAIDLTLAVTLLGSLLTALAPVTDGDALCYHLQVPKVFLTTGAATFEPDLHETVYPLLTEMLYAVALALQGPVACRLVQWALGLCFAANVAALARPVLGARARWAAAMALGVPAVSNGMGAPLNDVALAAFGNAALFAWTRWLDRPSPRAALLAGTLAGMALGVKYPALVLAGLLGMATVMIFLLKIKINKKISNLKFQSICFRSCVCHATLFGAAALAVGGGWYWRAYFHTGNPVYPFFRGAFGGAGLDEVLDPIKRPLPVTPWHLLTALGPMTLRPDRFDSVAHQFGPAFLLFLPGLLLVRPPRRVVGIGALGFAFLTLCLTQRQSMRFVLIAVGPLSVAVAWLASRWADRPTAPARMLLGALVLMLGAEATLAAARARHGLGVVIGRETAAAYLDRREPTHRVGRWIAAHLPDSARLVGQDHRGFYLPRPYTMELAHRRRTGLGTRGESPEGIVAHLRASSFTHLLMCPPVPETAVEFDPTLSRRLAPWLARQEPLYRADLADADGVVRRYAIYSLMPEAVASAAGTGGHGEVRR